MLHRKVSLDGKEFTLDAMRFSNGCFFSLSEGKNPRIGSLTVSVSLGGRIESTTIIPGRLGDIFSKILSEAVANMVGGIAIVSTYMSSEPSPEIFKVVLKESRNLLESSE